MRKQIPRTTKLVEVRPCKHSTTKQTQTKVRSRRRALRVGDSLGICLPFKAPISWEYFLLLYEAPPARPPTTAGDYLSSPGLNEEEEEEAGEGGRGGDGVGDSECVASGGVKYIRWV